MYQITCRFGRALQILSDELTCRLRGNDINLLEGLILGLRHEKNLVEPAYDGDVTGETQREADARHSGLHVAEETGDELGAEEVGDV